MAMIACPECGRMISDRAPVCLGCGITKEIIQEILAEQAAEEAARKEAESVKLEELIEVPIDKVIERTRKAVGTVTCIICKSTYDGNKTEFCPKCNYPYLTLCNSSSFLEKERKAYRRKMGIQEITLKTGQNFQFGRYQGEEINWRVLAVENNKALLITEQAIDEKGYNERFQSTTWENCTLRKWLNSEFYRSAFTKQEKRKILETSVRNKDNEKYGTSAGNDTRDRVFLLSIEEANKLFRADEDRICKPTPYTKKKGCWTNDAGNCWWWLRSPGTYGYDAAGVYSVGAVDYVDRAYACVRPALWINLES